MDELALFQLENLARTPTRFAFYDLRAEPATLPAAIQPLMQKAIWARPEDVFKTLLGADREAPIVLICESGKTSRALALRLEGEGFANLYIVAGGVDGLLSES